MSSSPARALFAVAALATASLSAQPAPAAAAAPGNPAPAASTAEEQTRVQQTTPPPAPDAAPPLTLQECIALAMHKNFDLQIQGYSVQQAREALRAATADFLPTLTGSTNRILNRSTALVQQPDGTTLVIPRDSNSTTFRAGVNQRIPETNGTVSVSGTVGRTSTQYPKPFNGGLTATISQPLLNGAGKANAHANIELNKLGLSIAQVNYRSRVLGVIRDTEDAYYNLVAAREALRIRQLSLSLAQQLLTENQARRATGVATDLDVATAEVGVANARNAVVQADSAVHNAEDSLQSLINVPDLNVRPGPVSFDEYTGGAPTFAVSYKMARDNYPDTLSAEDVIKQLEIDVAVAKRNRLPTVNLNASIGYSTTDVGYYDVIESLPTDHGDNRSLSLTYSIPWGLRADRARYRSAVASLKSQQVRLEQLETQLLVSVRSAVRAVQTNLTSVQIAAQATQLAAKQYDLQKARFDAGLSTSRLVLQAQDDLETARFNELSARVTLRIALAELHRLEGSSIDRWHVELPQ